MNTIDPRDTDNQDEFTDVIIEAVADHIQFDSEEEEACFECHRRAARLFWELEQADFIDDLLSDAEEAKVGDIQVTGK